MPKIDDLAYNHNLPLSLLVPIAVRDLEAIRNHIGTYNFIKNSNEKALIVDWKPYDSNLKSNIYTLEHYKNIHQPKQIWVTPDFKPYRKFYFDYFEDLNNKNKYVIDHLFNRRLCKLREFNYIRLLHIERGVNSSSGRGQESHSVNLMIDDSKYWTKITKSKVAYADPFDLVKMVNLKTGKQPYNNVKEMFQFWY